MDFLIEDCKINCHPDAVMEHFVDPVMTAPAWVSSARIIADRGEGGIKVVGKLVVNAVTGTSLAKGICCECG